MRPPAEPGLSHSKLCDLEPSSSVNAKCGLGTVYKLPLIPIMYNVKNYGLSLFVCLAVMQVHIFLSPLESVY